MNQTEDSLHSEWELMYCAGLTVRQIADTCHAHPTTIRRHLHAREAREPGLRAFHESALPQPVPGQPSKRWLETLSELECFVITRGHFPRYRGTGREKSLYAWLTELRGQFTRQQLSWQKAVALDALGDWVTTERERSDEIHWNERFAQVQAFLAAEDRIPRTRHSATEDEHKLAVWLGRQRQADAIGRIPIRRQERLAESVPGWESKRRRLPGNLLGPGPYLDMESDWQGNSR